MPFIHLTYKPNKNWDFYLFIW